MELLKYFLTLGLSVLLTLNINAQNYQLALEDAFAISYEKEEEGEIIESIDALKKVYDKSSYEINLRLGWLNYNSGQFNEAYNYYSIAQELKPFSEEARLGLVLPLSALGKWDDVIQLYNVILDIHPNNTVVMFRLGMIYYSRKDYNQANMLFKKVVDLYPFDYDGLLMLAWTSYFQGNYNQAKVLFYKVKLAKPNDESANEGLALLN